MQNMLTLQVSKIWGGVSKLIESIISYGLLGWGGETQFHLQKITILQKKKNYAT